MNGIDFSLPDLGLAIAGFGAGGALLYSSRYVPGKYKAAPILGGMIGVALGGYYIYRAFVPQEIPPEPPDPQPGDVTATVLAPVSIFWSEPLTRSRPWLSITVTFSALSPSILPATRCVIAPIFKPLNR